MSELSTDIELDFAIIDVDEKLYDIGHYELFRFADFLEKQSRNIRERAKLLEGRNKRDIIIDARLKRLWEIPEHVCHFMEKGHSLPDALDLAAKHTASSPDAVKHHWNRWLRERCGRSVKRRNRLIMALAEIGRTNKDIGHVVCMHPMSISRIIGQQRLAQKLTKS